MNCSLYFQERPGTAIYVPEVPRLDATVDSFPKPTRRDITTPTVPKGEDGLKPSLFMQSLGPLAPPSVAQGLQTREEIDSKSCIILRTNEI